MHAFTIWLPLKKYRQILCFIRLFIYFCTQNNIYFQLLWNMSFYFKSLVGWVALDWYSAICLRPYKPFGHVIQTVYPCQASSWCLLAVSVLWVRVWCWAVLVFSYSLRISSRQLVLWLSLLSRWRTITSGVKGVKELTPKRVSKCETWM